MSPRTTTARSAAAAVGDGLGELVGVDGRRCRDRWAGLAVGEERAVGVGDEVLDLGAAGVGDRPAVGHDRPEAVEDGLDRVARVAVGHPVDLAGRSGPVAEVGLRVVGVGTEDGDRARGGAERVGGARGIRERAVVGEEDE